MDGWMDGWMDAWMRGWMDECTHGRFLKTFVYAPVLERDWEKYEIFYFAKITYLRFS